MSYATILVLLDTSRRVHTCLKIAAQLAVKHNAGLIGMLACAKPGTPGAALPDDGEESPDGIGEPVKQEGSVVWHAFQGATDALPIMAEWRVLDGPPQTIARREAHLADLLIVGQQDPDRPDSADTGTLVESIVLESGRPVLVVPYAGWFKSVGWRVLVAWNGSREAARAVHDALPLLQQAQAVTVMTCCIPHEGRLDWRSPASQFPIEWLERHGVTAVSCEQTVGGYGEVADRLLSQAADLGVDLLVAGAYGHSKTREQVFGGVTRTLLRSMTVPMLLSH